MIRKSGMRALLLASTLLLASPSAALSWPGFTNPQGLKLNGSAQITRSADGTVLRLTPAQGDQAGSAFSQTPVNAANFSTAFSFRITGNGGDPFDCNTTAGADGLVFVVQPVSNSLGLGADSIGYGDIPRSVGVEFDTWCNEDHADPNASHVAIDLNGDVTHTPSSALAKISPDLDNGQVWYAWIDYNGRVLEVRLSQQAERPDRPTLQQSLDLPAVMGARRAYVGFTSGTGADWANHDVLSWEYREAFAPLGTGTAGSSTEATTGGGGEGKAASSISGVLNGAQKVRATCLNLSTNRQVEVSADSSGAFDCSAAGLDVAPGHEVQVVLKGIKAH